MKDNKSAIAELGPNEIIRKRDARRYFGFSATQIDVKIKSGEIPTPIRLSPSGRAVGWLGSQVLEHHRRLLAAAERQIENKRG